ncbi:MAG TPA: hypothetical protein VK797_04190 [Tepidisphaeraceae bacterium]|jgi:hypothetical protein|nr:hypothetical protein [Tepidisphaeraceae bacterium]
MHRRLSTLAAIIEADALCVLAIGLFVSVGGCCAPINPTPDQVKAWVSASVPPGSSEGQVKAFCTEHGFDYGHTDPTDPRLAQAYRRVGGCEATMPIVRMDIQYDSDQRVRKIEVEGFAMLP